MFLYTGIVYFVIFCMWWSWWILFHLVWSYTLVTPYCRILVFSLSSLANLSRNKGRTVPSGSQIWLHFFISPTHLKSESLPLPNWYYNKYTQRALYQTKIITMVNFLTLVLCSFGWLISLVINKSCQWLTFALKSFQKRLSCSRGFTVSVTTSDLLKLYL